MAEPEVAVTVMGYVPAGVPPVWVVLLLELPQAAWKQISPSRPLTSNPPSRRRMRDFFPPKVSPNIAMPPTGRSVANMAREPICSWLVIGRMVVLMVSAEVTGPLFASGRGLVLKEQVASEGRPEEQDSEMLFGNEGNGVTVTV